MTKQQRYHRAYYIRNRKHALAVRKVYREKHPDKVRDSKLRSKYNITLDDYSRLLVKQNGVCAICRKSEVVKHPKTGKLKPLTVDHNHKTGKARGLVCHKCNAVLGYVEDSPIVLRASADYLEKHS